MVWTGALLLSLLSFATSLSTQPQNDEVRRKLTGSSSSPSPLQMAAPADVQFHSTSSRRRDVDVFPDVLRRKQPSSSSSRRKRSTTPALAAPLVDSALLRFLSSQKKQVDISAEATTNLTGQYLHSLAPTTAPPSPIRPDDTTDAWLGQYNVNRVAQSLMAVGVDNALALKAGDAVQSHVLARTARRRVREFLKQRDKLWLNRAVNGVFKMQEKELMDSSIALGSGTKSLDYGLVDVIDLLLEVGLTGTDIATIFAHTPSVALMRPRPIQKDEVTVGTTDEEESLGETLQATVKRSFEELLCMSLKLRKYDARKVLRNCPGLLTKRGSKSATQVVTLLSSLGVSKGSLVRDKNALPVLLSRSPAALFRLAAFLSSDAVRMPVKKIGPLIRGADCSDLLNAVAPVPRLPVEGDRLISPNLDMTEQQQTATLMDSRGISELQINDIYRKMSSTAMTLRHKIGTEDLGKVIAAYPSVLLLDAETQILPTASYLMEDLGIWEDDLPRVLQLYPALLGMNVTQMEKVTSFLLSLDVAEESLGSIFRAFPALLTLDVEKTMMPVIEFLRSIGIINVGRFVTRLPPILGYSVENELIPKWDYLFKVCMYGSFELSAFPAYFSYPLDRVIKTRYEYIRDVKGVPPRLIALDVILRFGDRDFATQVARDRDGGVAFANFVENRKKKIPATNEVRKTRRKPSKTSTATNARQGSVNQRANGDDNR